MEVPEAVFRRTVNTMLKKKKRDKQLPTKHNAENKIRAPRISLKTDVNSSVLKTNNICNLYSQSKQ